CPSARLPFVRYNGAQPVRRLLSRRRPRVWSDARECISPGAVTGLHLPPALCTRRTAGLLLSVIASFIGLDIAGQLRSRVPKPLRHAGTGGAGHHRPRASGGATLELNTAFARAVFSYAEVLYHAERAPAIAAERRGVTKQLEAWYNTHCIGFSLHGGVRPLGRQARPRPRRRAFIIIFAFTISIAIGAMAGVVAGYFRSVPPLDEVNFDPKLTTYIYDVKGRVIARLFTENRIPVRLHEIPEVVRLAFIAAEDSDFYQHHGIDFFGIARAALVNLRAGAIEQGGSTITQQLAKLAFLTNDRTWSRKFKELLLAIQIERKYTKDEILESYLNVVYFGHGAYGVEAASQIFFQKSVSEVNLHEAALLAAVVNGPGYYSPFYDMEAATRRRNLVLRRMLDLGFIDQAAYDEAVSSPIELKDGRRQQTIAPH